MALPKLTIPTRLYILTGVFTAGLLAYAVSARSTLNETKVNGPYYAKIVQGKDLIADILPPPNYIIESYLMALHMANEVDEEVDSATISQYAQRLGQLESEFHDRHDHWKTELADDQMKQIKVVDCYQPAIQFYNALNSKFLPACAAGDSETAQKLARGALRDHYEVHRNSIDKVVAMATERCAADEAEAEAVVNSRTSWATTFAFMVIGGCCTFGWWTARQIVGSLKASGNSLRSVACRDLKEISNRMKDNASGTSEQAGMVRDAAETVSTNVQSLATAVEEFDSSIKEISGNTTNAANVARTAVEAADQTTLTITKLGESSSEISNVIKVINSIAEQTNLLALNATIEAARAGEAGKGFAVVANEVKELAKQTSTATEDIIGHIEAIQTDTQQAVTAITHVSEIIRQINESQNAIASAVEEQSAMTGEISRNIAEVSNGSDSIARNIAHVAETAASTKISTEETLQTSDGIELLAMNLLRMVGEVSSEVAAGTSPAAGGSSSGKYQLDVADSRSLLSGK